MESLLHHSNKVQGVESLYFEDAQILKFKHDRISYASAGPLSVLYFKEYDRFVLKLNDWKFPLIKRLPILGMDHNKTGLKTYILPAANGFLYKLTIDHSTPQAMLNFESILRSNSCFAIRGEEAPFRKIGDSPNDKLTRKKSKETGPIEIFEQTLKTGVEKAKVAGKTLTSGTLGLNSRKQKLDLKKLRNKNFKKKAHSSFNQDFFNQARKETQDFLDKRENNINLVQTQPLYHLKRGPDLPTISIFREDLEESILHHKDLASLGHFNLGKQIPVTFKTVSEEQEQSTPKRQAHEAKGFFEVLKQGLLEIKDTFSGLLLGTAGNNYMEQDVAEPETIEIPPQEKPQQEEQHRHPSIGDRIKSGVNEFIHDVSLAWHDSADNLRDKPELQQREAAEMRDPALDETNQNLLVPGGVRNWEGLTHYQG